MAYSESDSAFEYMFLRLVMARFDLNSHVLSPSWVKDAWNNALKTFSPSSHPPCDALMFGNDKSALPLVLVGVSRLLGIPSVMEMPNLYPHYLLRPEVIVADSMFVLLHHSVRSVFNDEVNITAHGVATRSAKQQHEFPAYQSPQAVVMSPGVDVESLQRAVASSPPSECFPGCGTFFPFHSRKRRRFHLLDREIVRCRDCFTIGMVCRLSPEKSIGFFLLAAHQLVFQLGCQSCRFVIIGDGKLRESLALLAMKLGLSEVVKFEGHLPRKLWHVRAVSVWDVAVTTGAWAETFSIAGLELMALGVPLVTYATGGMGEYVTGPSFAPESGCLESSRYCEDDCVNRFLSSRNVSLQRQFYANFSQCPFYRSENAIVMMDTNPLSLALGIEYLISNPKVRDEIGLAGIGTASRHFHIDKTRKLYERLFHSILS